MRLRHPASAHRPAAAGTAAGRLLAASPLLAALLLLEALLGTLLAALLVMLVMLLPETLLGTLLGTLVMLVMLRLALQLRWHELPVLGPPSPHPMLWASLLPSSPSLDLPCCSLCHTLDPLLAQKRQCGAKQTAQAAQPGAARVGSTLAGRRRFSLARRWAAAGT